MKRLFISLVITATIMLSYSSCYYDSEGLLYGNTSCDTTGTVSYSQRIVPMFQQYCYSCHTGSSPSGNILMGTYAADKIIAGNGKLYGSITHSSAYVPMPEGQAKMSDCQIATIKKWVDGGVTNN